MCVYIYITISGGLIICLIQASDTVLTLDAGWIWQHQAVQMHDPMACF